MALSLLADPIDLSFDRQLVEARQRQTQKQSDAALEGYKRVAKRSHQRRLVFARISGVGNSQCAVIGWPGHTGQVSFAAESQSVNTKSILGAPGAANSSQLLLRNPSVEIPACCSWRMANGWTTPCGWLPALYAVNRGFPLWFKIPSARIDRARFPVHKKSTL
jgi:hypothetical protein